VLPPNEHMGEGTLKSLSRREKMARPDASPKKKGGIVGSCTLKVRVEKEHTHFFSKGGREELHPYLFSPDQGKRKGDCLPLTFTSGKGARA